MSDLTGKTLGRYRILERIGRGGMAEVYKGYQASLDRYVAVKVLHSFLLDETGSQDRFAREARAVAALRHPNIVQVFDYDNEGDVYFMVMEFVDGPNLKAVLEEQARQGTHLDWARMGEIVTGIGAALAYAHRQGMIHRDVKPHNILFTADGTPLLTDFGIAKIVGGSTVSASGMLTGTPAYMSPEQGRSAPLDGRTDIYSLGVVLYEMATGHVPYDADTPFAVVIKHITEPLPMPSSLVPAIPDALEQVILRAMEKAPEDRYQTADELVRAVQTALGVRPDPGATLPGRALPDDPSPTPFPVPPTHATAPPTIPASPPAVSSSPPPVSTAPLSSAVSQPPALAPVSQPPPISQPPVPQPLTPNPQPPAPPRAAMTASLAGRRLSCTVAVSVLAVLVLLVGSVSLLNLNQPASSGGSPPVGAIVAQPTATALLATGGAPPASATAIAVAVLPATATAPAPGNTAGLPTAVDVQPPAATANPAGEPTAPSAGSSSTAEGDRLLAAGQFAQALAAYTAVLAQDPQNEAALLGQARAYMGLHRWSDAVAASGQVLARDKSSLPALLIHAQASVNDGDTATADADFAAAVAAHPADPTVYRARGEAYLVEDKPAQALADFQKALDLAPNVADVWIDLGTAYVTYAENYQAQPDRALDAYNHALQLDPQDSAAYVARARIYQDYKSDPAAALADISKAITLGPATADMYYLRSRIERTQGDDKAALADLNKAVGVDPQQPDPYQWRSQYFFDHGQYVEAIADAGQAIALGSDSPAARLWRSQLYLLQADYAHATADAQQAIAQAPAAAEGYEALTHILSVQGNYSAALAQATKAVTHRQAFDEAEMFAARGRIYLRLGELPEADADLTSAVHLAPDDPTVLLGQAELAVAHGQPDAALSAISRWTDVDAAYGWGYILRAQIEANAGDAAKARADLAAGRQRALFPDERKQADTLSRKLPAAP